MATENNANAGDSASGAQHFDGNSLADGIDPVGGAVGDDGERGTTSTGTAGDPNAPADPLAAIGKRGRGRPRKNSGEGNATGSASTAGSSQNGSKTKAKLDLNLFALQVVGIHKILAMFFKAPELMISDDEGKKLASAIENVMQYHKITIAPQTLAYGQLLGVCAAIYGPRVAIVVMRKNAEKKQRETEGFVDINAMPQPGMTQ